MAEFFYELCLILKSQLGESKHKQQVKIISNKTNQNVEKNYLVYNCFTAFYMHLKAGKAKQIEKCRPFEQVILWYK